MDNIEDKRICCAIWLPADVAIEQSTKCWFVNAPFDQMQEWFHKCITSIGQEVGFSGFWLSEERVNDPPRFVESHR